MTTETSPQDQRPNLGMVWFYAILLCLAVLFAAYQLGKTFDCSPNQVDGQCGLVIFMGIVTGLMADAAILLAVLLYTIIRLVLDYRKKQRSN